MIANNTFISELNKISEKFDLKIYNEFNWFKVMYKMTEEKPLHSRFIAFLLNPKASHKMGTQFLELFLKEIKEIEVEFDFDLKGAYVTPSEIEKNEKFDIDICIENEKQVIIIENKIFAGDSNDDKDEGLFSPENNSILDGDELQLVRYYNKKKQKQIVKIIYLTIDGKNPSYFHRFPDYVEKLVLRIKHLEHIQRWLSKCINICSENNVLKTGIEQYRQATKEFLNDVELAKELKMLSGKYLNESFCFWNPKEKMCGEYDFSAVKNIDVVRSQFIHVRWHTVFDFMVSLKKRIEERLKVTTSEINLDEITDCTHRGRKTKIDLVFLHGNSHYYVCNDQNGFSIGIHKENKTADDFKILEKDILFSDFSKKQTFDLISEEKTKEVLEKIVNELQKFVKQSNT